LTVSSRLKKLYVKLPRYDLEFSTAVGEALLGSKELPGFFVASVQSVGTLIGLQNKLVLRSTNGEMMKLFIPDGGVTISRGDIGHPRVTISPSVRGRHIKVFTYDVDDILGRVAGDGSLTSWYQLAFLHAATTSHFADPLLSRTGICQTQEMLGSAQAFAFMRLESEHHAVLQQILDLVPTRKYYPTHLTSMETIEWNESLSVLVQCARFAPLVNAILDYADKQALFHTSDLPTGTAAEYKGKLCLWERADVRVARLVSDGSVLYFHFVFVSLTRISVQLGGFDMPATPIRCLECPESTAKEHDVAQVVALVREWPTSLIFTEGFKLWDHFERWKTFSSEQPTNDRIENYRAWLQLPAAEVFFRLFHLCRSLPNEKGAQYGLMVALGILGYRKDIDVNLIRTLLTIAANGDNSSLRAAASQIPRETFNLYAGRTLVLVDVSNTVAANCHQDHPDSSWMERRYGEEYYSWTARREKAFHSERQGQCETMSNLIFRYSVPKQCAAFSDVPRAAFGLLLVRCYLPTSQSCYPTVQSPTVPL
jgi:hypothetical protein